MKFRVNKKPLFQALQVVVGAIAAKTTIPILQSLLLVLKGKRLYITGSDLDITINTSIELPDAEEEGQIVIPARIFYDIVKELPNIELEFETNDELKVNLSAGKGKYKIAGESADEYPQTPLDVDDGNKSNIQVESDTFVRMINNTMFAVSTDELRTTMMGVYFKIEKSQLHAVATDSHRLARVSNNNKSNEFEKDCIIPVKGLNLLLKVLDTDNVSIELSENFVIFDCGDTKIVCRAIEGNFPNYERVIPKDGDKFVQINKEKLIAAFKRVSIFSNTVTNSAKMILKSGVIGIYASDVEFGGEASEEVECEYMGEDLEIGVNSVYMLEVLRHVDTESVIFQIKDATTAMLITPITQKEHEDILLLQMPVRLAENE